jgi:glycosyltransferase involved in cell wall biosynthesis
MIVQNKTNNWIHVGDLDISIPPIKMEEGKMHINNNEFYSSEDIMSLINSGLVVSEVSTNQYIMKGMHEDIFSYSVPSTDIWSEGKDVVELKDIKRDISDNGSASFAVKESPKKRYRIKKNCAGFSISLDTIGKVLSKHIPELVLEESQYHDEAVQRAIVNEKIVVVEILEEVIKDGKTEWAVVKSKDELDLGSMLAPEGAKCAHWEGPVFDGGGYANMNRQVMFHLDEMGWSVKPTIVSTKMDVERAVKERIYSLSNNMIPAQAPKVFGTTFPNHHYGKSIAYTMMETENQVHPLMVHKLKIADEIWTPCEWNRRVFRNSGITADIRIMPLGVDHERYRPEARSLYFGGGTNGFIFLSVFQWHWRKGPDAMLKAYIRAFTSRDDVSLVMVSRYTGNETMSQHIISEINEWTANERSCDRPHLALVDEVIPTYLMPKLYNSADAFCLFSRGEGWGLPYCEAAASGMPVIGSDHGGQQMFLNDDYATLVRPDLVVKVDKSLEKISHFYHDMEFVSYSERAIDEMAEKMRWAYENRDQLEEKAHACRMNILNNFTWKHAAERAADRLSDLQP